MNHEFVEKNVVWLGLLIVVAIAFGGLVEIVPLMFQSSTTQPSPGLKMRTPLDFAVAGMRATGRIPDVQVVLGALNAMGQPLWNPPGPKRVSTGSGCPES